MELDYVKWDYSIIGIGPLQDPLRVKGVSPVVDPSPRQRARFDQSCKIILLVVL